jgi:hypothetical protein
MSMIVNDMSMIFYDGSCPDCFVATECVALCQEVSLSCQEVSVVCQEVSLSCQEVSLVCQVSVVCGVRGVRGVTYGTIGNFREL